MAGKKRKASGRQPFTKAKDTPAQTKFDYNETFDDSEDEFVAGRDHILLEDGPETKRRRKIQEEEAYFEPSDEEVLGYEDEDDLDEEDFDEDEYEDDGEDDYTYDKSVKRQRDGTSPVADKDDEEEGLGAWGTSKKSYYNADTIETEADALEEEEEAKRLQQKHLRAMKEADFGFDEIDWVESGKGADESTHDKNGVITEVLPQLEITDEMSAEEQLKILKSRYPEFEPLAKDFVELQPKYPGFLAAAEKSEEAVDDVSTHTPISIVKFRALSAYLGSISMYFALLTSPAEDGDEKVLALPPTDLREHPVMESLVKCRKLWEMVKDLQIVDESEPEVDESDDIGLDIVKEQPEVAAAFISSKEKKSKTATSNEKKLTKSQRAAEKAKEEAQAHRLEKIKRAEAKLTELNDLVKVPSNKSQSKVSQPQEDDDSDFGDEGALTAREVEEKAKKRRSLRFYTSQLAQKNNKRDAAGRNAGGDEDLPYRERLKDRQARLNAEAERRGRAQANEAEQLGGESDDDDHRLALEIRGDAEGTDDDEYYDMVAARNKQKKADKEARAELAQADQGGRVEEIEEIGPDGKRRITYQIEKNKGLAPKRNKDVRNPRVKKRKKYEQKKKKLGSIRQVYKGGEGRGGYGGELTGIKKNLVKSVKL
ncbi:Sas10 C-terminal domain-containing protein [Talaromyces proteolyticus]|uniref:Sas10 C-terminal domain-containing protein n=1 Tax=Talaromyces proteolyticus TaxID=1131652 RepID=A0AAD4PY49_9EURO|nr:Sas10 C-terminal domain-containing protein [Talaromyces proteolyticus]KAH8697364.1 Sas10 C-terminal domain-containing protein [Talaromyces proteolyticus]